MNHIPVKSSHIKSVGHDPETNTLAVTFHSGGVYHYHGVPKEKHDAMLRADSVGKYLEANIKGTHRHSRVS